MKKVLLLSLVLFLLFPSVAVAEDWKGSHCVLGVQEANTAWYFAEGCTRAGFNTWLCIENPNTEEAKANIQYFLENGEVRKSSVTVPKESRTTVYVNEIKGEHDVSMKVTSDLPVVVERPMYFSCGSWTDQWNTYTGGSCVMGVNEPKNQWFFGEGCTQPGFQEWLCIVNPNNFEVSLNINYFVENADSFTIPLTIPANTRYTRDVFNDFGVGFNVSIEVVCFNGNVIAERPLYYNYQGRCSGGDSVMGVNPLSNTWYFAEGTTWPGFDTWLTMGNPNWNDAKVDVKYLLSDGASSIKTYYIPARARLTKQVNEDVGDSKDTSIQINSNIPIVAERPMYGPNDGSTSVGSRELYDTWLFAEGTTRSNFDTWLCVGNPNNKEVEADLEFYTPKGIVKESINVKAYSRNTILLNEVLAPGTDFSTKVTSDDGIVVERPMYFIYQGMPPIPE